MIAAADSCQCVILAGGLGTRMYPDTCTLPKTLLDVAGKPFAHYQLSWLAQHGVHEVLYCIGHLGGQIRDAVGDGSRFGLAVRYCDEGEQLRGTAGALHLAAERGLLAPRFLVTYGDSFLRIDFGAVLAAFREADAAVQGRLVVFRNQGHWDASNVRLAGGKVALYQKGGGPEAGLDCIDYGLCALRRELFTGPSIQPDLSDLYHRLSLEGRLDAHLAHERFFEIGSRQGLADFERWLAQQPMAAP